MNKIFVILGAFLFLWFSVISANALSITTSASGSLFGDSYSYEFTIEDTASPQIYSATLLNTSSSSLADALIDLLAFNMDATQNTDFGIFNVNPNWTFSAGSGGTQFDYVGKADPPGTTNKLGPGDALTFDFVFEDGFTLPDDPFSLWTNTDASLGTGIGGGGDFGQVAVSFQQLGSSGNDSDLLASNWQSTPAPVPEPATMLLLGTGLIGIAGFGRKRKK